MDDKIAITGADIIGWDGTDPTGALKELGVEFTNAGEYWKTCQMNFEVDMDFVLRHNLLNHYIYPLYKQTDNYKKYYGEGRQAYLDNKKEDNPYEVVTDECMMTKRYPWYEGYRETEKSENNKQYNLDGFDREFKELTAKYKLEICREDEYGYVYLKTPKGYIHKL